jgi:hypothetical protein
MRLWTFVGIAVVFGMLGSACAPQGISPGGGSVNQNSAPDQPGEADTPDPTPGDTPLLNEVLFNPAEGQSAFVEIKTGQSAVDLTTLSLTNQDGGTFVLPAGIGELPAGSLVLVRFDGQSGVEGALVHASPTDFLATPTGSVSLMDNNGGVLDTVTWGGAGMTAVRVSRGGAALEFEAGASIGRVPDSVAPSSGLDWVTYDASQVIPGTPNPTPGATILIPLDGMEVPPGDVALSWYPVPGAAQYRVQLSTDSNFATTLLNQTVTRPPLQSGTLAAGTYFWRVETLAADGSSSGFSAASTLILDETAVPAESERVTSKAGLREQAAAGGQILNVPLIEQHKDTHMLLLESNRQDAGHEWDQPHPALDETDWADNMNCGLASIAMINAYKGGQLSQDRIGYQILPGLYQVPGPEWDLMYARGLFAPELQALLDWALGTASVMTPHSARADFYRDVQTSIANDMPLVLFRPGHFVVISGWRDVGDRHKIFINDPWHAHRGFLDVNRYDIWAYWVLGPTVQPQSDEAALTSDGDGDGIKDFDETMRFGTDPGNTDTDSDCSDDKDEIRNSMFDPAHGWALLVNHQGGDGRARMGALVLNGSVPASGRPELDADSDGGGMSDFAEDLNGDGRIDTGESDPTNPADDHRHITGTIVDVRRYEHFYSEPNYSNTEETSDERYHVDIDLETDSTGGKLTGTANVQYTNHAYRVYRNPFECDAGQATQLNIDRPDRQWTVNLTGGFACVMDGGQRVIHLYASGTPDHGDGPDMVTYHDVCYSDTTAEAATGSWGGFNEVVVQPDAVDVRVDYPLPTGVSSGEDSHEVHLTIAP